MVLTIICGLVAVSTFLAMTLAPRRNENVFDSYSPELTLEEAYEKGFRSTRRSIAALEHECQMTPHTDVDIASVCEHYECGGRKPLRFPIY